MVYSEATLAVPLIAGYAYHKGGWKKRKAKHWTRVLENPRSRSAKNANGLPGTGKLVCGKGI